MKKCKTCQYFNKTENICNAFPQCTGLDYSEKLPCEIEHIERRRKSFRECQKRRREWASAAGFCTICVKNPARDGMKTCAECSNRISAYAKMRRASKNG